MRIRIILSCAAVSVLLTACTFRPEIAIVAHRGFWNCDEAGMAKNSIASLAMAQKNGVMKTARQIGQFDVNMTSDAH